MEQVVNFPTRKQNTPDLLTTNISSFINKCIPVPGFGDYGSAIIFRLYWPPKNYRTNQEKDSQLGKN